VNGYTKSLDWRVLISEGMGDAADDRRRFVAGVYAESGPRLYRYALMILADRRDAEDVLQQVFAAVLSKRSLPVIDDAGAYFRTAVRNAAYSLLRQRRTARAAEEMILEPIVPGCSLAEQAALGQALRALPPEQREVVHLHVYEGMTFQEVAAATAESINTVSARYRYALDKIRRMIL
jgi:RNA polymerase sigma-70 factor (ECF subfamily)